MNDSHEDLVRLAQEAKMYKDLARELADSLADLVYVFTPDHADLFTMKNASELLTKYRETLK